MPRAKKNEVWENFLESGNSKSVRCKHCDKTYKFANVNKMQSHLIKCFKCPVVIRNKFKRTPKDNISTSINMSCHNESVTSPDGLSNLTPSPFPSETPSPFPSEISRERKQNLDELFAKAVFVSGAPFSMVEHPLWTNFFGQLQPLYKLPSRKTLSTTHLEAIYKDMEKEITEELKCANVLHLQCDGWSNQRNEGIINFIIAKPEPIFVKSVNTLTNRHTSQYIAEELLKVVNTYGAHKFLTVIGDNANNMQRAFQIVQETYTHIIPLRCVAHTLNLLCEDCMTPQPVEACIKIAIQTIKAIKKSQTMSALLAQIVKEKGAGETLKLPGKTRWGSYCTALKSLKVSKVALQTLAVHEDAIVGDEIKSNLLDSRFWIMIESGIKLLEPISEKIFKLEGNGILINQVYMAFKDIKSTFSFVLPESEILDENDKVQILNAVDRRMSICVKPIHYAAYLLDPRSQGIDLEEEHKTLAMEFIYELGEKLNMNVLPDFANYMAKEGIWGKPFIWKNVDEMNPKIWWKGLCSSKVLSKLAVRILTAPCTSAATERSFSTHGHIHSTKRNRLTTDRAAKMAYISYNWNLLHKHEDNDEEDEPIITPTASSPISSPLPQPSTSRGITESEFCDVNAMSYSYDSESSE